MGRKAVFLLAVAASALVAASSAAARPARLVTSTAAAAAPVRIWTIRYPSFAGQLRTAYLELPSWYGPHRHPPIPLVLSPHGRGTSPFDNLADWGDLAAAGGFGVVSPEGQGRRLTLDAWGYSGDVSDLARMPALARQALPWLRVAPHRVYAVGGSMGGQEALLLAAREPGTLAGVVAFDPVADLAKRFAQLDGTSLGRLLAYEVGGTPATDPLAYSRRSPIHYAARLASGATPLQIWWSTEDNVVPDQEAGAGGLYRQIVALNPSAPVSQVVGSWLHTSEMWYFRRLPEALAGIGLLPPELAGPEACAVLPAYLVQRALAASHDPGSATSAFASGASAPSFCTAPTAS